MRKLNVEAIVLKNIAYKDSHKIYTLFTKERGKISAIARGVRKISSRRAGSLDTLNQIHVNITEGRGGFYSINEVQVINSFNGLKDSLDYILTGMYFAELVDVFLEPDHENHELYRLLKSALTALTKKPERPEIVVNVFELRLLEKLGIGLSVDANQGELAKMLNSIKNEKNLNVVMDFSPVMAKKADTLIKHHLKLMVETYARFPRLNKFLSDSLN